MSAPAAIAASGAEDRPAVAPGRSRLWLAGLALPIVIAVAWEALSAAGWVNSRDASAMDKAISRPITDHIATFSTGWPGSPAWVTAFSSGGRPSSACSALTGLLLRSRSRTFIEGATLGNVALRQNYLILGPICPS